MRNLFHIIVVLFFGSCGLGCTPSPSAPVYSDAMPDGALVTEKTACDEMAAVGCLVRSSCAATIAKVNADTQHMTHIDINCIAAARSTSEVTRCGVDCPIGDQTTVTVIREGDAGR